MQEIEQELLDCKKEYGEPRRCQLIGLDDVNNIPSGTFKIVITNDNEENKKD